MYDKVATSVRTSGGKTNKHMNGESCLFILVLDEHMNGESVIISQIHHSYVHHTHELRR